jgi:hypothetical protein
MITSAREPTGPSGLPPEYEDNPTDDLIYIRRTHPGDPYFDYWLDQRHKYMQRMGWELEAEHDRYDDDPKTTNILITDDRDRLIVGMRLTPVDDYKESLSWEMLKMAPQMQQEVTESGRLDSEKMVWDLTKLVQGDTKFDPELSREAIGRLFGEGLQDSRRPGADEPVWVFAITKPLFRLLSANGMHLRALSQGRINSDDRTESVFGYVHTIEDLRKSARSSIARTTIGVLSDV